MRKSVQLASVLALGWAVFLPGSQSALAEATVFTDHPATWLETHGVLPVGHKSSATISDQVTAQRATPVRITDIQITSSEADVTVRLITEAGMLPEPTAAVVGNALILDFLDVVLALPDDDFEVFAPMAGIALVAASQLDGNRVQVTITGAEAPPAVDWIAMAQGLALSITVGETAAAGNDRDRIQILVTGEDSGSDYFEPTASTATRIETPLRDIPQSIQVISRELLEVQQIIRLDEALRNLSGVVSGGASAGERVDI